jgi:iron complex outermembrane receptor protein
MTGKSTIGTVGQQNQLGQGVQNRWHHYLSLNWVKEGWDVTLAETYFSGYRDQNSYAFFGTNLPGYPRVASYSLFDLTGQYKLSRNWIINGGIKNLFDRDPPYSNISAVTNGFDPSYADPRGRAFWLSVTYSLR